MKRQMPEEPDSIISAVRAMKARATSHVCAVDWPNVERDLRSYVGELQLNFERSPDPPDEKGSKAVEPKEERKGGKAVEPITERRGIKVVGIVDARNRLKSVRAELGSAKKFPETLQKFLFETYGVAGSVSLPHEVIKQYNAALKVLGDFVDCQETAFKAVLSQHGTAKGGRGSLLDKAFGSPIDIFLDRFVELWQACTGGKKLGDSFESAAKAIIDDALRRDTGDLKRQIRAANKRAKTVRTGARTEWELMSGIGKQFHERVGPQYPVPITTKDSEESSG